MKNASTKSWHEMGDVSCCNASPAIAPAAALSYYLLLAFLCIIHLRSLSLSLSPSCSACALLPTFTAIKFFASLEFVSFARKTAQFRSQCSLRQLG